MKCYRHFLLPCSQRVNNGYSPRPRLVPFLSGLVTTVVLLQDDDEDENEDKEEEEDPLLLVSESFADISLTGRLLAAPFSSGRPTSQISTHCIVSDMTVLNLF